MWKCVTLRFIRSHCCKHLCACMYTHVLYVLVCVSFSTSIVRVSSSLPSTFDHWYAARESSLRCICSNVNWMNPMINKIPLRLHVWQYVNVHLRTSVHVCLHSFASFELHMCDRFFLQMFIPIIQFCSIVISALSIITVHYIYPIFNNYMGQEFSLTCNCALQKN